MASTYPIQPSVSKFKEFLLGTIEEVKSMEKENIFPFFEERLRTLIEADQIYILMLEPPKTYNILSLDKTYEPHLKEEHLFSEVIKKKQPLLLKDLEHSLLYKDKLDNLLNEPVKEVALVPVKTQKDSNIKLPDILVWGAIKENSDKSFSQKQILYMIKFLDGVKPYFPNVKNREKLTLEQCLDNASTLEKIIERDKRYFHSIIHDVRTPMNALIGFLDLLALNETDPSKKEYLQSALKSGEHMVRLINDALDVAKIESGELPIEKKPFDLHDTLADTVKIFYETARKKNITFAAYIDPKIPEKITSDQYRIKQVLSNLLSNAIKFTPEDGSVLVEAEYFADKDIVTISVTDTGIGIKKEALEDIFVAYRQEGISTERDFGGTGLGLNISYQIVSLLGGRLTVDSTEGKGSTFAFDIPALTPKDAKPLIEPIKINNRIRLYRWEQRKDLRAKTIKRYLKQFDINLIIEKKERSLGDIYQNSDYNSDDIFIIEQSFMDENDYEYAQQLLDKGCHIILIDDNFSDTFNYLNGNIIKLSYPVLAKKIYQAIQLKDLAQAEEHGKKIEFDTDFKGKKILIVDDNRINLKFMDILMTKMGLKVRLTNDAETALEKLSEEQFDMLIIDENMPKMLGSEAISIIKDKINDKTMEPLTIISLSGDSHHSDRIRQAGADEILTKPVSIEKLKEILERYL